jgi:SAM-dependent methyltransferase
MSEFNVKKLSSDDWNDHWQKQNDFADFNPGQILRHKLVFHEIEKVCENIKVLVDFGSGQGDLIKRLSNRFKKIHMIGLEYSQVGVDFSALNNPEAEFYRADLTLPLPDDILKKCPDLITCCDVMEHIDAPELVVKNAFNMLKTGGYFIVTLPGGPMTKLDHHIGHRKHYDRNSLENLLREGGFENLEIYQAGWPFFNLYRLMLLARGESLVDDVSIHTSRIKISAIKIIGTIFSMLFRLNAKNFRGGWQMFAIARKS